MLTADDRRARRAMIAAYCVLQDPDNHCVRRFERRSGFLRGRVSRCMLGEIGHQLGLLHYTGGDVALNVKDPLMASIIKWFCTVLAQHLGLPEYRVLPNDIYDLNDTAGHGRVVAFLRDRITDLDAALAGDPTVVPWEFPEPVRA